VHAALVYYCFHNEKCASITKVVDRTVHATLVDYCFHDETSTMKHALVLQYVVDTTVHRERNSASIKSNRRKKKGWQESMEGLIRLVPTVTRLGSVSTATGSVPYASRPVEVAAHVRGPLGRVPLGPPLGQVAQS
jgi:hypothetical protein